MEKYQTNYTIWTHQWNLKKKQFGSGVLLFCDFWRKNVEGVS
jgi:hypothetical protein